MTATQPNPHSNTSTQTKAGLWEDGDTSPPMSKQTTLVVVSYLVCPLVLVGTCVLPMFVFPAIPLFIAIYLFTHCALAWHLTTHYWQRLTPILWLPWVLKTWFSLTLTAILIPSSDFPRETGQVIGLIVLCGTPLLVLGAAYMFRRQRADAMMILSIPAPLAAIVAGIVTLFRKFSGEYGGLGNLFGALVIVIGLIHLLPMVVGLIYLGAKNRLGATPDAAPVTAPDAMASPNCSGCKYNLSGTVWASRSVCPECGAGIPEPQLMWIKQNAITQSPPTTP
jgi:hypothetical protein